MCLLIDKPERVCGSVGGASQSSAVASLFEQLLPKGMLGSAKFLSSNKSLFVGRPSGQAGGGEALWLLCLLRSSG